MENSDKILDATEEIKKHIRTLKYPSGDIRYDFFTLIYDVLNNYYYGCVVYELAQLINDHKIAFSEDIYKHKVHIDRITEIAKIPMLERSYKASFNRSVIIDSWSAFEFCVTVTLEAVSGKQDLSRVPISKKINSIFLEISNSYQRSIKDDKLFLHFYRTFRNSMHSNFIYNGDNFRYEFEGITFIFRNHQAVVWNDDPRMLPDLYVKLIDQLLRIFEAISEALIASKIQLVKHLIMIN